MPSQRTPGRGADTGAKSIKPFILWGVVDCPYFQIVGYLEPSKQEAQKAAAKHYNWTWKKLAGAGFTVRRFRVTQA